MDMNLHEYSIHLIQYIAEGNCRNHEAVSETKAYSDPSQIQGGALRKNNYIL